MELYDGQCKYMFSDGKRCTEDVYEMDDYCFWHSPDVSKEGKDIKPILEIKIRNGESLEGFNLSKANLQRVNLVKANLKNVKLDRANLRYGSLFGANLEGASLFKTDFESANLKNANLDNADLLGTNLDKTKFERVFIGKDNIVKNEIEGDKALEKGDKKHAHAKYVEAEEIYRNIKNNYKAQGLTTEVGDFFYREMRVKRKLMSKYSLPRLWAKLIDFTCGYGEKPYKIISASLFFMMINAIIFCFTGYSFSGSEHSLGFHQSIIENIEVILKSVYFSIVTFTTLGYGDITPIGFSRFFAVTEAFLGAFMMALFVLTISKKMMDR